MTLERMSEVLLHERLVQARAEVRRCAKEVARLEVELARASRELGEAEIELITATNAMARLAQVGSTLAHEPSGYDSGMD